MPEYALAIDLGTTTLATSLINTSSGKRLAMMVQIVRAWRASQVVV